ncbi:uncharacterized protein LOC135385476 isoform X2 [Ornithodoros turicata]|uniref:uncharacterized protein LOC135385476 isoform X2 n=1 Tax=Ornithodoros turicata TaxID=34597 RepID=UPI003138C4C6
MAHGGEGPPPTASISGLVSPHAGVEEEGDAGLVLLRGAEGDAGEEELGARRPMNAFFLFCKRHRSVVRDRYPHLENRSITKILGEWWATLEPQDKKIYTQLAKQYKEAFMKANPDFKWCKMPTPPTRTLLTRTKGSKGDPKWGGGLDQAASGTPPPRERQETLEGTEAGVPRVTNCSRTTAEKSKNDRGMDPASNFDEKTGKGSRATSTPPPSSKQQQALPVPPPSHPPMNCKPPKKRYLENMENGTYSAPSAAAVTVGQQRDSKSDSSSSPSPSPSPAPVAISSGGNGMATGSGSSNGSSIRSGSRDQQTSSACSALLELAEGCQSNKRATPPTRHATRPVQDGPVAPPGFGPIPMFDVSAANRIIDEAFSQPTVSSSPSAGTSSSLSTSIPSSVATSVSPPTSSSASSSFFNLSSAKCLAQTLNRRPESDELPLNLSKERPTTTIKTSQQDIIDHIIEKFLCGPSNVTPMDGTVFSAEDNVPAAAHIQEEGAGKRGEEPCVRREEPPPPQPRREELPVKKREEVYVVGDVEADKGCDTARTPGKGMRRKGAVEKGAPPSPCKRARGGGEDDGGESSPERGGDMRKSQRSCKGQRYQALLSEGMLVPGAKDRKLMGKDGKKGGEEESGEGEEECEAKGKRKMAAGGAVGKEDDGKKGASGRKSSPFNLEAEIAALPKCSMDLFTRKKKKRKGEEETAHGEFSCRDDRFQSDTDPAKDPDFRPSGGVMRRIRHQRGAGSSSSPERESTTGEEGAMGQGFASNKFKTGDFDLEEHLAALPKCDIEVLSRRRKARRRDSGSSSGKPGAKDAADEDSTVESDAGTDATEENGAREDWHSEDDDHDDRQRVDDRSERADKRRNRKECSRPQEEFTNSLAALADIALSQKDKIHN